MADLAYLDSITAAHSTFIHSDDGATSDSASSGVTRRQRTSNNDNDGGSMRNALSRRSFSMLSRRLSRSGRRSMQSNSGTEPDSTSPQPRRQSTATVSAEARSLHLRIVPNIEDPSRCLIFDIVDRELKVGETIRLGRFADRSPTAMDQLSFKTKVVSRTHCEIWVHDDGKLYLRDMGSSSGTFLNHSRLCPANQESRPVQIKHGDIVQLGVDYQGGQEEIYRSVRMRFELALERRPRPLSFSLSQFSNLKALSRVATNNSSCMGDTMDDPEAAGLEECCICLYALAPFQALFVAPCSHSFHFICIRTLLRSYPGFQCPICRTYSDLESCVAMEPEEILAKYGLRCKAYLPPPMPADAADVIAAATSTAAAPAAHDHNDLPPADDSRHQQTPFRQAPQLPPLTTTTSITLADITSQLSSAAPHALSGQDLPTGCRDRRTVLVSDDDDDPEEEEEEEEAEEEDDDDDIEYTRPRQQRRAYKWMGKLKMTFFEKHKEPVTLPPTEQRRERSTRPRPVSYPSFLHRPFNSRAEDMPSGSS